MLTSSEPQVADHETRSQPFRWSRAIALITCAFLVGGAGLYYLYISKQETYLVNRNFRLLAMWSQVTTKTLASYETVFANVIKGGREKAFYPSPDRSQYHPYTENPIPCPDKVSLRDPTRSTDNLKAIRSALCDVDRIQDVQIHQPDPQTDPAEITNETGLAITASKDKDLPDFILQYTHQKDGEPIRITAHINIAEFMEEITKDTAFDDIILAKQDGSVVYQKNPTQFRWANLHVLLKNTVSDSWFSFFESANGAGPSENPPPSSDRSDSSSLPDIPTPNFLTVEPAGVSFRVFSQPVIIPGQSESTEQWIVCGLISSDTFREDYLKIPFTYLMVLVFFLLCAILGLPLLRLWIMAPEERVRRFHMLTLLFTSLIGTAILTFFLLDSYTFLSTKARHSSQLQLTAQTIHDSFREELHRILYQLRVYDWSLDYQEDLQKVRPSTSNIHLPAQYGPVAETQRPNPCRNFPVLQDHTPKPWRAFDPTRCYAPYDLVFWMNANGVLDINWTRGQVPGVKGTLPLKTREYVKRVRDDTLPLWQIQFPETTESYRFYIQPIISWTTGWNSVVVSLPSHKKEADTGKGPGRPRIVALETRLTSVMNPLLPPGTGFAILQDQDGLVLFHSEKKRNLRENFFLETDENRKLQGYVFARNEGDFEGRYWGKDHQFYVQPIKDIPWSLVVFREKSPLRTINFEMLLFAGALFTFYAVIVGGIFGVLAMRALRHGHAPWIWPAAAHHGYYVGIAMANGMLVVLGCLVYRFSGFDPGTVIVLVGLLPFAWCGLLFLLLRHASPPSGFASHSSQPASSWWHFQTSYAVMTTTFLVVFAAFPAGVFFKIVHDAETTLLVKQEQLGLMRALAPEHRIPTFQYYDKGSDSVSAEECDKPAVSWWSLNGVYPQFLPCTVLHMQAPAPSAGEPFSWFTTFHKWVRARALYGAESQETWGLIDTDGQNDGLVWAPHTDRSAITLHASRFSYRLKDPPNSPHRVTTKTTTLNIQSHRPIPPWALMSLTPPFSPLHSEPMLIGVPIFFALLIILPQFILRRTLYVPSAPVPPVGPSFRPQPDEALARRHLLILGIPGAGKSRWAATMHHAGQGELVDIRQEAGCPKWETSVLARIEASHPSLVILDHFEYGVGDPELAQEKALLIEKLLRMDLSLCVLSTFNPMDVSHVPHSDRSEEDSTRGHQVVPRTSWAALFQNFGTVYFFDPGDQESLRRAVAKDAYQHLSNRALRERDALLRTFVEECGPNRVLQGYGQWIQHQNRWIGFAPDQLVSEVRLLAENYYRSIWETCSREEKFALSHLAQDRFLHVQHPGLPSLLQKGLVRVHPDLRLMNQSFRRFVISMAHRERLEELELAKTESAWNLIKWPLLLILGVFIIGLMATQQQFRTSVITLLSLLPILLPAMPELPGFVHKEKISD